jgi:hypothetical protein
VSYNKEQQEASITRDWEKKEEGKNTSEAPSKNKLPTRNYLNPGTMSADVD